MDYKKDMSPQINTVLQEGIYKTEYENFQSAYKQAKSKNDSAEMKRLYELALSMTSRDVRHGSATRVNPYFEDLFDKKEFTEFMQNYEEDQKNSSPEHMQDLNAIILDLAGRGRSDTRINPYFKEFVDKREYDELMKLVDQANQKQDTELAKKVGQRIQESTSQNSYMKDYLDKLQFERLTKQIEVAQKSGNEETLKKAREELTEYSGRDPQSEKINPYIKDDIDKKEFNNFQTSLEMARKNGDRETEKILLQRAKDISGINDSLGRINPYIRQYFDEIEAQKYISEREQAQQNGDKANYDRVTELMRVSAGNIGYVRFDYSPSIEQSSEKKSFRESIVLPKEEQDRLAQQAKIDAQRIEEEQKTYTQNNDIQK